MTDETIPGSKRVLTPKERRQRNRDEMVAAILDAARAVMCEEGVAALNLQEVTCSVVEIVGAHSRAPYMLYEILNYSKLRLPRNVSFGKHTTRSKRHQSGLIMSPKWHT